VVTRCVGDVTVEEVAAHLDELAGDPACPSRVDVFLDLTGTTAVPFSDQIRAAADRVAFLRSRVELGACAIVARSDALYGMLRMFEVFAEGHFASTRVFRDARQAEDWLSRETRARR
jgi:hypothetical protein